MMIYTTKRILENKIKCLHCCDTLISLYGHEYTICQCGKVGNSGGKEYLQRIGEADRDYKELSVFVGDLIVEDPILGC